jgi:DNA-binding NarL/FixJ family response regulator
MSANISVLLAEDDPLLRNLLTHILAGQEGLEIAGTAANGREALAAASDLQPDVLLLDLHLPELSGMKVLERCAETEVSPKVLVLSGDEGEDTMLRAARAGARGFLSKSGASSALAQAIRAVAAGEVWFPAGIVSRILAEYPTLVRSAKRGDRPIDSLSDREREVLVRLARGLTNQQIAGELYISVSSVKVHIRGIFQKLNLPNRTEAAVFAVREGLLDADEVERE